MSDSLVKMVRKQDDCIGRKMNVVPLRLQMLSSDDGNPLHRTRFFSFISYYRKEIGGQKQVTFYNACVIFRD